MVDNGVIYDFNDINDYHDLMKLMMGEYGVLVVYRGDVVET